MQNDYIANVPLLTLEELEDLTYEISNIPESYNIIKKAHEYSETLRKIAQKAEILSLIKPILGDNVILWGCKIIRLEPSRCHKWHLDVEHTLVEGVTLSLAVNNFNDNTIFKLISNTHDIPYSPQEHYSSTSSWDNLLEKALEYNPKCELKNVILKNGEFIAFKGRVWHSTINASQQVRTSIVFQYCRNDALALLPSTFNYPNIIWSKIKPYYFPI